MKKQSLNKKLSLNKKTVTKLDGKKIDKIKGGLTGYCTGPSCYIHMCDTWQSPEVTACYC